jgi:hypothetical protein
MPQGAGSPARPSATADKKGRAPQMSFAVPEYQYVEANNRVLLLPMQRPMSEGR